MPTTTHFGAHATAQLIGNRSHQCDTTATYTHLGTRAYALLDGIGSSDEVRDWTRATARRLARTAARRGAHDGLRALYNALAAETLRQHPYTRSGEPSAAAIVAVAAPNRPLTVAWCGDSRAYLLEGETLRRLTNDHNLRRVYPPSRVFPYGGNRNVITSHIGAAQTDQDTRNAYNHPATEAVTVPAGAYRLLLASDGAYAPLEDAEHNLTHYLTGTPAAAARYLVGSAINYAEPGHADNATALIADLH
jgi:serine/threonine protein phosphatase PrpC